MPFKALIEELIFSPILLVFSVILMVLFYSKPHQKILRAYHIGLYTLLFILTITSWPLLYLISAPLQHWVQSTTNKNADAIVVLGSLLTRSGGPSSVMGERIITGTQLFIEKKAPLIITSGGVSKDALAAAKMMKAIASGLGISQEQILLNPGHNTFEEAVQARTYIQIQHINKIILVTNWYHMPRALAVWQKQGFDVIPYTIPPPDFRWHRTLSWENIKDLQLVCHEYLGLIVYKIRGWT